MVARRTITVKAGLKDAPRLAPRVSELSRSVARADHEWQYLIELEVAVFASFKDLSDGAELSGYSLLRLQPFLHSSVRKTSINAPFS